MFRAEQIVQTLNQTLNTTLKVVLKTGLNSGENLENHMRLIFESSAFTLYGDEKDVAYLPLFNALLTLDSNESSLSPLDQAWIEFLSGANLTLPKTPSLQPDKKYRLCKLSAFDPDFKSELLQLASELLQGEYLYNSTIDLIYLLEDQSGLLETLNAFYETLALDFNQNIRIYISSKASSSAELVNAYSTITALEEMFVSKSPQGPVDFETHMCDLLLNEWLSHEQGGIYKAIEKLGISAAIDEETIKTIEMLFKLNLNLSETARALYIHRNTLIYRIEKIQKQFGFDLRSFDDCYRLKLLLKVNTLV